MILANLTRAIREQNYYAVVLEFLIVIAGVVIGFQITAWNQARSYQSIKSGYLIRLSEEIGSDAQNFSEMQSWWQWEAERDQIILNYLNSGDLQGLSQWEMINIIYGNSGWTDFYSRDLAYNELQNTGRMDLIDVTLREDIIIFYNEMADYGRWFEFDTPTREFIRQLTPGMLQSYILRECEPNWMTGSPSAPIAPCTPFENDVMVEEALNNFRSDINYIRAVRWAQAARNISASGSQLYEPIASDLALRLREAAR